MEGGLSEIRVVPLIPGEVRGICTAGPSEPPTLLPPPPPLYSILWPTIDTILATLGQICNFRLILNNQHFTLHLQYKHSGTFANGKYEELPYPKNQKICDPILVTLLKLRPHYSHSSRENATSSSDTFPLASCKEVPPHPLPLICSCQV